MLVIHIVFGVNVRKLATGLTVLEALQDLAYLGREKANTIRARRALEAFGADKNAKPTITVTCGRNTFSEDDQVNVYFQDRTEYYKLGRLMELFTEGT